MWSWINAGVDLVAVYPAYALAVVFLAAIIEAVAVLGILVPGTPILMAVAGAAAMAGQPVVAVLALSIIGAGVWGFFSFLVGGGFLRGVSGPLAFFPPAAPVARPGGVFRSLR